MSTQVPFSSSLDENERAELLAAALETWLHLLLYVRCVYPRDTFQCIRFLGVRCKANRHPVVASYISDSLRVAVPVLLHPAANEISLIILDGSSGKQLEKYSLVFSEALNNARPSLHELETVLRSLILSTLALDGQLTKKVSSDVTFKIILHVDKEDTSCHFLTKALSEGIWYCSRIELPDSHERCRPLQQIKFGNMNVNFYATAPMKDDEFKAR